ncbi:CHASE domain-containing protein [Ideonella sp. BN130291]|uniref:CHASE domain-containing protein n=1 Tax=Ideonella sp. BN130291 TaxID=3112940 RepID=UPI002E26379C|nr:CHASE domain-containing protein [Ideonella sp. BN130291]
MTSEKQPPTWLALPATAVAYLVTGWIALSLATAPSYAAPLYPSAGIALACVLVYGARVLPGVALGAFAVNLLLTGGRGQPVLTPWVALALPVAIGLGAALQAWLGALLVRQLVSQPLTLSEPRDVARFFVLGALLACTVSASVATGALHLAGAMPAGSAGTTWWIWWAGDALGVLIGAPVALTLIGRPRSEWAHRRNSVGLSLVLVTALLATAAMQVARWDEQRTRVIFERDAGRAADALVAQLDNPLHALEAMRGTAAAMGGVTREALRTASAHWLMQPFHLKAIGWAERVPRDDIARFEAAVRAELGMPGYKVFDRSDPEAAAQAREDADVVAIRYIEPPQGNQAALGVNPLSISPARPALEAARVTGRPQASGGFRLTQEVGDQTGVVIYQALYQGNPGIEAQRRTQLSGMLFATLRMEEAVQSVAAPLPPYLRWCLVDTDPRGGRQRLAGGAGCEHEPAAGFAHTRAIDYAGRHWELRLTAAVGTVPESRHWNAWLFSLVGLMATSMLGALLLTVTGRTRRIEVAVAERTADLRHEVAERTRTEAALRESEQRFRNILDHVPIGLIYTDLNGRIQEANPKLRDMIGYSPEELVGKSILHLTHPQDRAADIELGRRVIQGVVPVYRRQKRYIARDGSVLWVQATVSALRDPEGRPLRMVGVVEDITEHLKLEEAERARETAEAANRAKSDFVSRMSHELRTPLNAMLGFAQLLELDRQAPLRPHQIEWTAQIQQAGWHLLHMINDTLDLSRIESGTLRLQTQAVPVAEVVQSTCALVEQAATQRRVTVEQHLDPAADAVLGDETRVKQILTNLLSNAVKYNVEGGRVLITSRLAGPDTLEIEVRDSGLGMDEAQMAELFQPFNRLGRESHAEGTGIGLVISRRLAELMGGALTAQSRPGEGSSFRLVLPLARRDAGMPVAPLPGQAREALDYHQRLVHYIEDNETNAEVMRGILAQRPQVRLKVSGTGLDGLAAIRQQPPSLVLLDMHLPDVDGLELLRHLKQDLRTADIPVIVVSADATRIRIDEAMALGAAHYVTKPVNVAAMLRLLDEVLEQQDTRFSVDL